MEVRNKSSVLIIALLVLFVFLLIGISNEGRTPGDGHILEGLDSPNVVMISVDPLRSDHMPCYGYDRNTTPNICNLAEEGYKFENVQSEATWTLPAYASLLTSYYPRVHNTYNASSDLSGNFTTLTESLRQNGYETAAFVGSYGNSTNLTPLHLNSKYNLDQGFSVYSEKGRNFRNILPYAEEWMRNNREEKFFMFIQSYNTHPPFEYPHHNDVYDPGYTGKMHNHSISGLGHIEQEKNYTRYSRGNQSYNLTREDVEHLVAEYDGSIRVADRKIGNFIAAMKESGEYNESIIIVYSAHGISLGDKYQNNYVWGLFNTHKSVINIPLIIKMPKSQGRDVKGLAQMVDIGPTLLDILDIDTSNYINRYQGKSLVPNMAGKDKVREYAYTTSLPFPGDAIQSEDWKYVEAAATAAKGLISKERDLKEEYYRREKDLVRNLKDKLDLHTNKAIMLRDFLQQQYQK